MIRFLQTPGPIKKIVLGGILVVICVSMAWYVLPGGSGTSVFGSNTPQKGVVASVGGQDVTTLEVQKQARQMVQQQHQRLRDLLAHQLRHVRHRFTSAQAGLRLLGPQQVLARGYSITMDENGKKRLRAPIFEGPSMATCEMSSQASPNSTLAPMVQ